LAHPRTVDATVKPGDVLAGKYRVDRVLGVGGMGVVVAAHHMHLDELVALKLLLPEALASPEAVARFEREARAAVKIKSEHIARVSDVGHLENGAPFMVMEYLEGTDLEAWVRERGPLHIDQACEFVLQACEAIAEAHALGIVHRDLKPANLFCVRRADGLLSVKVLDFGISKVGVRAVSSPGVDLGMTRTSSVVGSPLYMSPEQLKSAKRVDTRSDIWSLGVILFELVAGRPPFDAESVTDLAIRIATTEPLPIRALLPTVPPGFERALARCMEKERDRRFQTVGELATALGPFAPPRAASSVDRILRTVNKTEAPPLLAATMAMTHAATIDASSEDILPQTSPGAESSWGGTGIAKSARTRKIVLGAAAGGGILLLAVCAWLVSSQSQSPDRAVVAAGPSAAIAPLPSASVVLAPAPSPTDSAEPLAATTAPPPTASAEPLVPPTPATPHKPAAPSRAPTGGGSGAKPSCDPPYVIDSNGHRQYKPQCL
jgi:serine/threonine-protein kinase